MKCSGKKRIKNAPSVMLLSRCCAARQYSAKLYNLIAIHLNAGVKLNFEQALLLCTLAALKGTYYENSL